MNPALRAYRTLKSSVSGSVRLLSVLPGELGSAIERVQAEAREQKRTLTALREELAHHRATELVASARTLEGDRAAGLRAAVTQRQANHPLSDQRANPMLDQLGVPMILEALRQTVDQPDRPIRRAQQQGPRIRRDRPAVDGAAIPGLQRNGSAGGRPLSQRGMGPGAAVGQERPRDLDVAQIAPDENLSARVNRAGAISGPGGDVHRRVDEHVAREGVHDVESEVAPVPRPARAVARLLLRHGQP